MKDKLDTAIVIILCLIVALLMWLIFTINVKAEPEYIEPVKIRATCYTWTGNRCSSGIYPYEGVIAGRPEWSGYVAILYDMDMNYIGMFEFRDTGGAQSLKNGTSIDVYRDTLQGCYDWIDTYGDWLYIQVIPAVG